jgi:hypothetical protein
MDQFICIKDALNQAYIFAWLVWQSFSLNLAQNLISCFIQWRNDIILTEYLMLLSNISWLKKQGMRLIPLTFRNEKFEDTNGVIKSQLYTLN